MKSSADSQSRRAGLAAGVLLALPVFAQSPPRSVHISAPRNWIVSGTQLTLTAVARDISGVPRAGDTFTWSSNQAAILDVNSSGVVTARGLGMAQISAVTAGVRASVQLQVIPQRIEVSPAKVKIDVGDRLPFTAVALDANGEEIPGVNFQWQVNGAGGPGGTTARMSTTGVLSAAAVGRVSVLAMFNYPGALQGFIPQVVGLATAEIRRPSDFRVRRLLSSDEVAPSFTLRPVFQGGAVSANESGQVAVVASLGGLAEAVLLFENGRFDVLASTGAPAFPSGTIGGFGPVQLNNRGQAVFSFGGGIMTATREGASVVAYDGLFVGRDVRLRDRFSPYVINDAGDIAFVAGYLDEKDIRYEGVFKVSAGSIELIWTTRIALPGASLGTNVQFGDVALDDAGNVYFQAGGSTGSAIYSRIGLGRLTRVVGTGDTFAGLTVGQLFWLSAAGDGSLAFQLGTSNGSFAARLSGSSATVHPTHCCGFYLRNTRQGGLLIANIGQGHGAYLLQGDTPRALLLTGRLAPNGEPITSIDYATLTAQGDLIAAVRTVNNPLLVVRPQQAARPVLFQSGDLVDIAANLTIGGIVGGARAGPLRVAMGGFSWSLFELTGTGLAGLLVAGDRLPTLDFFFGANWPRENAAGDIYFGSHGEAYRIRDGRLETIPTGTWGNRRVFVNSILSAGDGGAVLFHGGTCCPGTQAIYLVEGNLVTTVVEQNSTQIPGFGTVNGWNQNGAAMAGDGRIMLDLSAGPTARGLFLWERGVWTRALTAEVTQVDGATVAFIGSPLKVQSGVFYAPLAMRGGFNILGAYRDGTWQTVIGSEEYTPLGVQINNIGNLDLNGRGDIAFVSNVNGGAQSLLLRVGGETRLVVFTPEATEEGDYLTSIGTVVLRDDRRIYFLAQDADGRTIVYEATPLF